MANSQAVATLTIQDQDLLGTVTPISLVTRANVIVTTPASLSGGIFYGGYLSVNSLVFANLFPGSSGFVYIRNATNSTDNAYALALQYTSVTTPTVFLQPGGVFLYANPVLSGGTSSISNLQYAASNANKFPIIMEYLYVI
jgi:hypothetical protein